MCQSRFSSLATEMCKENRFIFSPPFVLFNISECQAIRVYVLVCVIYVYLFCVFRCTTRQLLHICDTHWAMQEQTANKAVQERLLLWHEHG
jgi:hypothetical protein